MWLSIYPKPDNGLVSRHSLELLWGLVFREYRRRGPFTVLYWCAVVCTVASEGRTFSSQVCSFGMFSEGHWQSGNLPFEAPIILHFHHISHWIQCQNSPTLFLSATRGSGSCPAHRSSLSPDLWPWAEKPSCWPASSHSRRAEDRAMGLEGGHGTHEEPT